MTIYSSALLSIHNEQYYTQIKTETQVKNNTITSIWFNYTIAQKKI